MKGSIRKNKTKLRVLKKIMELNENQITYTDYMRSIRNNWSLWCMMVENVYYLKCKNLLYPCHNRRSFFVTIKGRKLLSKCKMLK